MALELRIGTRASKLACKQAEIVRDALLARYPHYRFTFVPMTTAGDRELHKTLGDWGYKGLFTKELEDALYAGSVDFAVHSMKDMPSVLSEGLALGAVLPREDVRDAWISPHFESIEALPSGAVVGTSSARRKAQLLHLRPDVTVVSLRGNVETRLRKVESGEAAATFLAAAGLNRLGLHAHIRTLIPVETMLPALAQGAIGVEYLAARPEIAELLAPLNHAPTAQCIAAERALLQALDGSCRTSIGGLCQWEGNQLRLRGEVLSEDGRVRHHAEQRGHDPELLGRTLGQELRAKAGPQLLQRAAP